jgi:hypothetical protein
VIGFQAMPQLRAIYGHDEAATLLSCPTSKAILRTDEPETAEWCSRQIGGREVVREQIGTSTGPRELRDGFTMQPRHRAGGHGRRDPEAAGADRLSLYYRARSRQGGIPLSTTDPPATSLHRAIAR